MSNNRIIRTPANQQIPEIMAEMKTAADKLEEIGWGVSVFGSARIRPDSPYYALGEALGERLAKAGLPVIAGGGPGIMEAANKGAFEAGGTSIGLNIKLPREKENNQYQTHSLAFDYFYSRKATFFMHSVAYIALPGGWGTLDEVFEVLTLVQTRKVPPAPIVLIPAFKPDRLDTRQHLGSSLMAARYGLVLSDDLDEVVAHRSSFQDRPSQRPAE